MRYGHDTIAELLTGTKSGRCWIKMVDRPGAYFEQYGAEHHQAVIARCHPAVQNVEVRAQHPYVICEVLLVEGFTAFAEVDAAVREAGKLVDGIELIVMIIPSLSQEQIEALSEPTAATPI